MKKILLLGAGTIGSAAAKLLASCSDYETLAGDRDRAALRRVEDFADTKLIDFADRAALRNAMRGRSIVISTCTYEANAGIASAALDAGASYFDITEDVATMHAIQRFAKRAKPGQIFMPQCGLAPGFVSIVASDLASKLTRIDEVRMRVGALPRVPKNQLKYNITWSVDGLINEYANACEAIVDGKLARVDPLGGVEHFKLAGFEYEAFNTSGGAGTLPQTLSGKVRALNYKTIRYPGHRDLIAFLFDELKLKNRRVLLKEILETAIPPTRDDVVVIYCEVTGWRGRHRARFADARKIFARKIAGEHFTAIRLTTAASLCAVVDLHTSGRLPQRGFIKQEQVTLADFLANRFGRHLAR